MHDDDDLPPIVTPPLLVAAALSGEREVVPAQDFHDLRARCRLENGGSRKSDFQHPGTFLQRQVRRLEARSNGMPGD